MNYPFWDVPGLGSGWVIGLISIFHVLISHFAIGGGFYLPMAEAKALRDGRLDRIPVLRQHARFFLVLTAVFGAISGVGIWFAIGLASPEGTSTLIHNFVLGWAMEWVFFMVEVAAAAVYYYTWNRVPHRTHLRVGWVYAATAWASLAIINGILTFMLTPGAEWLEVAGTGRESSAFWSAFFNPGYWPSLVVRTLVCISLAGVWALVTSSRIDAQTQGEIKTSFVRWSAKWLIPAFVLLPFATLWYLSTVPEGQSELLQLGISTIGQGVFTQVTRLTLVTIMASATIVGIVWLLAHRNPVDFRLPHALMVLLLAVAATGAAESAREMLRKPYVVVDHMYSNGIRENEVEQFGEEGYLHASPWLAEDKRDVETVGELMLRGQCLNCHTRRGYRSLEELLGGRGLDAVMQILSVLREGGEHSPYSAYMPPLVGTDEEIEALAKVLVEIGRPLERRAEVPEER